MKGINAKNRLIARGYSIPEIANLIDFNYDEFMEILSSSEDVPEQILNDISNVLGENIFTIMEMSPANIIEGDNNMLGNNNNDNETILRLVKIIEKKEEQNSKLIKLLEDKIKLSKT